MLDLKGLVRRYLETVAAGDLETSETFYTEDWISYGVGGTPSTGLAELRANSSMNLEGIPRISPTIHDQVAEGDRVVTRLTWSGVHKKGFAGHPPTNKLVTIDVMRMDRFEQE